MIDLDENASPTPLAREAEAPVSDVAPEATSSLGELEDFATPSSTLGFGRRFMVAALTATTFLASLAGKEESAKAISNLLNSTPTPESSADPEDLVHSETMRRLEIAELPNGGYRSRKRLALEKDVSERDEFVEES